MLIQSHFYFLAINDGVLKVQLHRYRLKIKVCLMYIKNEQIYHLEIVSKNSGTLPVYLPVETPLPFSNLRLA